jgi:hypothetical protein
MNVKRSPGSARAGYIIVTILLAVVLLVGALVLVSTLVGVARGGDLLFGGALEVPAELTTKQLPALPTGVSFRDTVEVKLEVSDPSTSQILLAAGTQVGPFLFLVGTLLLLRGLARSVTRGDPFGRANVRRLRAIGFLLVIGAPVVELVNWTLRIALTNSLPQDAVGDLGFTGFRLPFAALLAGVGAFILAGVFAHGAELREDVEATV